VATVLATVLATGTSTLSAHAEPVYPSEGQVDAARAATQDKAAQVGAIENQLLASHGRLVEVQMAAEMASEKYNLARLLLEQRTEEAKSAGRRAAAAQKTADISSDKLGQFAATAYMQGGNLGQLEAFLSSNGPQEVLERAAGIQLLTDIRSRISKEAAGESEVAAVLRRQGAHAQAQQRAAELSAQTARADAQVQVSSAAAETANIQAQQGAMIAQLATLRNTSVELEGQRQTGLKAAAEARAAAAAKAAAQARSAAEASQARAAAKREAEADARAERLRAERIQNDQKNQRPQPQAPTPPRTTRPVPEPNYPVPSRGGVSAVIAYARAQIGKPYLWGGSGPSSWDCSGLTQKAWAQAGVGMSHFTGYQWAETRRIPLSDLEPGDLVFFGSSGASSHHVGLYVGNDMMINAPHTGALVRYDNIYTFGRDLVSYGGRP
jgi:cell wall-associated NlpC family hydrolase